MKFAANRPYADPEAAARLLLDIVRGIDERKVEELRTHRKYEQLEMLILNALLGRKE